MESSLQTEEQNSEAIPEQLPDGSDRSGSLGMVLDGTYLCARDAAQTKDHTIGFCVSGSDLYHVLLQK